MRTRCRVLATLVLMSVTPATAAETRNASRADTTPKRILVGPVVRVAGVGLALTALYVVAPLGERPHGRGAVTLVVCIAALAVVTAWELRMIARSTRPELRAVEAVAVTLPMALFPFAAVYYSLAHQTSAPFGAPMTRLDAVYFTVTTFATVGYGDITPKSQVARAAVLTQMIVDLVLIGLIAKVITDVARRRRASLSVELDNPAAAHPSPDDGSPAA